MSQNRTTDCSGFVLFLHKWFWNQRKKELSNFIKIEPELNSFFLRTICINLKYNLWSYFGWIDERISNNLYLQDCLCKQCIQNHFLACRSNDMLTLPLNLDANWLNLDQNLSNLRSQMQKVMPKAKLCNRNVGSWLLIDYGPWQICDLLIVSNDLQNLNNHVHYAWPSIMSQEKTPSPGKTHWISMYSLMDISIWNALQKL